MKHLKLFNESKNDNLYTQLSIDEWDKWEETLSEYDSNNIDKPFIDFPVNDFLKLKEISIDNTYTTWELTGDQEHSGQTYNKSSTGMVWIDYYRNIKNNSYHNYACIWKIEDDYYFVEIYRMNKKLEYKDSNSLYYKCDQMEGLIQCLKDNRFIK